MPTTFLASGESSANFSILYHIQLAITLKEKFAFDQLLGLKGLIYPYQLAVDKIQCTLTCPLMQANIIFYRDLYFIV